MGQDSKIEWTTHTFNPWTGCTKVSPGCTHCYAESWAKRTGVVEWGPEGLRRRTSAANWGKPPKWDRAARDSGTHDRVFCASLADVFEDRPELVPWRIDLFHLINATPHLDWLLLTKRPENVRRSCGVDGVPRPWAEATPRNVWLGATVEDQQRADERIPHLLAAPAAVRFLSVEPMLGPVDLTSWLYGRAYGDTSRGRGIGGQTMTADLPPIDWVIVGGESGHGARPFDLGWARSIVEQCSAAGVACFVKQMGSNAVGEWSPGGYGPHHFGGDRFAFDDKKGGNIDLFPPDLRVREFPEAADAASQG